MGRISVVVDVVKRAIIMQLGGYDPVEIEHLIYRANVLGDLCFKGKYNLETALSVAANARVIRTITTRIKSDYATAKGYIYARRKPSLRGVEVIRRDRERTTPRRIGEVIDRTCIRGVLAKNPGFEFGVPVDSKHVCLESTGEKSGIQGGEQV